MSVPVDHAVPLSVNRGVPVVVADAGCDFSRGVHELAKALFSDKERGRRKLSSLKA